MNLGLLTLENSTEQFLLNAKFSARELFKVIHEYAVFVRFEVFDEQGTLLLSTDLARLADGVHLLRPVLVNERREVTCGFASALVCFFQKTKCIGRWMVCHSRERRML